MFHHVRSVMLSGGSPPARPETMVGHSAARRLFLLERINNTYNPIINRIRRIEPISGGIDLNWSVNGKVRALKVANNDHLLLTLYDRIEEYDADGNKIGEIPGDTSLSIDNRFESLMSLLLQDSMYFHSAFHNLLSANHRQVLAFEITQIPIFTSDVAAYESIKFIISVAHCRLDFTINSGIQI